jgi:hypothetical protein
MINGPLQHRRHPRFVWRDPGCRRACRHDPRRCAGGRRRPLVARGRGAPGGALSARPPDSQRRPVRVRAPERCRLVPPVRGGDREQLGVGRGSPGYAPSSLIRWFQRDRRGLATSCRAPGHARPHRCASAGWAGCAATTTGSGRRGVGADRGAIPCVCHPRLPVQKPTSGAVRATDHPALGEIIYPRSLVNFDIVARSHVTRGTNARRRLVRESPAGRAQV